MPRLMIKLAARSGADDHGSADQEVAIRLPPNPPGERAIARQRRQKRDEAGDGSKVRQAVTFCDQQQELQRLVDEERRNRGTGWSASRSS